MSLVGLGGLVGWVCLVGGWVDWLDEIGWVGFGWVGLGLFGGLVGLTGWVRLIGLSGLVGWVCLVGGLG